MPRLSFTSFSAAPAVAGIVALGVIVGAIAASALQATGRESAEPGGTSAPSSNGPSPAPTESPTAPGSPTGVLDFGVAEEYLRDLTGTEPECWGSAHVNPAMSEASFEEADAKPAGSVGWLNDGGYVGSIDDLLANLGGSDVIYEGDTYAWLLLEEDHPYGQLFVKRPSPGGRTVWFLAGMVNPLSGAGCTGLD
jgi:hypothetical protein